MNIIHQYTHHISSWKIATTSFFLLLLCAAFIQSPLSQTDTLFSLSHLDIPDAQPFRTGPALYNQLDLYESTGIHLYLTRVATIDAILPLLQAALLSSSIALVAHKRSSSGRAPQLSLVPLVAMMMDYCENLSLILIMRSYPVRIDWLADLAMLFSGTKFVFSCLSIAILLMQTAALARTKFAASLAPGN